MGDHCFYNVVPESLFRTIESEYGKGNYLTGYMESALKTIGASNCNIVLQAEMLQYLLFNIGVDGYALIILGILLYISIVSFDNTQDVRFMRRAIVMLSLVLLFDCFTWIMLGRPGSSIHVMMNIVITLYYISQIYAVIVWAEYVQYRVMRRVMSRKNFWIYA